MKKCVNTFILLGTVLILANCSGPKGGSNPAASNDGTELPQAPKVSCVMKDSSGSVLRSLSNSAAADATFNPIVTGSTVHLDCTNTQGDTVDASQLNFQVNTGSATSSFSPVSSSFTLGAPGKYSWTLTVSDPTNGTKTVLPFYVYVQCSGPNSLRYNSGGLSVSSAGLPNYFNYNVSSSAFSFSGATPQGFTGNMSYSVDFNGDGVMDDASVSTGQVWSSPSTTGFAFNNVYNAYVNTRNIRVRAMDNTCFYTADSGPISVNFPAPEFIVGAYNSLSDPSSKPYYFIQGDVVGTNNSDAADNARMEFTQQKTGAPDTQRHVICNPDGKTTNGLYGFTIIGSNNYDSTDTGEIHDMEVHFNNLQYASGTAPAAAQTYTNGDGSLMDKAEIGTQQGSGESSTAVVYSKAQACQYQITIQRLPNGQPCNGGSSGTMATMRMYGGFNCPLLTSPMGNNTSVPQNGFFYCEANLADACVGGGGQGGGGIPPIPH